MFGILLIDKPLGLTSHGVIAALRRKLGTRRIGHAGTLDPLATGLLVVAAGPATRFLQYFDLEPKVYRSTFRFGIATTTYDSEGEQTDVRPVPANLSALINLHIGEFLGLIEQTPPVYSAIKKQGKPLYAYARKGEKVDIPKRQVFIRNFKHITVDDADVEFEITCSGGTYIRSLAHDLGAAVGCGAHVAELRRTAAGSVHIDLAVPLDDASADHIRPLTDYLGHLPRIDLSESDTIRVRNGQTISLPHQTSQDPVALFDPLGNVVGIGRVLQNGPGDARIQPECIIPIETSPS